MTFFKSVALAFRMYSKIPVPPVSWEGKHRQYVLCCFPLVGWVIGGAELLWWWLTTLARFHPLFSAAVAAAIPVAVTGGIHLDGFCDVCDALASHQDRERMLEIMKDSHIGAFVPISLCLYFLVTLGGWTQLYALDLTWRGMGAVCLIFPLERALSGLLCVTVPSARGSGLLFHFTGEVSPVRVKVILILEAVLYAAAMALCLWLPAAGTALLGGGAVLWSLLLFRRKFGGITGDLAGWFLQIFEVAALLGAAVVGGILP